MDQVWAATAAGDTYGLVPFENSSGGVVWPHLDRLRREQLTIVGEVRQRVRMCVGGLTPDALIAASKVYSHPKGLEQCSAFLFQHAGLQRVEVPATPDGPRRIRVERDSQAIALASRLAIEGNGLHVLDEDVADLKGDQNVTQFFILERNGSHEVPDAHRRFHAALLTPRNERGVLQRLLSMIDAARVDLLSLHSRSIGEKEYVFFLEMERQGTPEEFDLLRRQLEIHSSVQGTKWLGSWDARILS